MRKLALTLAIALASVLGTAALAQTAGPGEDRSVAGKPATATEKAAAKEARKAAGRNVAKTSTAGDDKPATAATGPKASLSAKQAAKAKRKAAGAAAVKSGDKTLN